MADTLPDVFDRCPVCKGEQRESMWTWRREPFLEQIGVEREQNVVICRHCGIIYRSPPLEKEIFNRLHETWAMDLRDDEQLSERIVWLRERFPRLGPETRVLEVGSARGLMLKRFHDEGIEAHGIEPNPEMVALAVADGLQVYQGYVEDFSPPEGSYDVVMLLHLLEHIDDPVGFLLSVRKLLKQDGVVYLEVPNLMRIPAPFGTFLPSFHRTEFVPATLTNTLRLCGLEPVAVEEAFGIRVLAEAAKPTGKQDLNQDGPRIVQEIQRAFGRNLMAKYLGELICQIDLSDRQTMESARAALRGSLPLANYLRMRLNEVDRHLSRWHNGIRTRPEDRWPNVLRDIVETLRDDMQLAILLSRLGVPDFETFGPLRRVTFHSLNVDDLRPVALAGANSEKTALEWLQSFMDTTAKLRHLLRLVDSQTAQR